MKYLFLWLAFLIAIEVFSQKTTASAQVSSFLIECPQLNTTKKIWLYLPKDYTTSHKKYPVIYMPDAQNLFDASTSYAGEWNIDETLDSLKAKVIVVGIEHGGAKRLEELTPFTHEKYGGGKADAYLDFIVSTLKSHIDTNYRTKSDAKNTCIFGSSLGGLTAFYGVLKYPKVFGKAGCFSPAFWINRDAINSMLEKTTSCKAKIYFLCGDNEGDDDMVNDLNHVEYLLNTIRCQCLHLNKKVIVAGGQHNEKLWREGFKKAYLWLF